MKLSEEFNKLKDLFDPSAAVINIPGSETRVYNLDFYCREGIYDVPGTISPGFPSKNDALIEENRKFKYPVFVPSRGKKFSSAILLLHGLNERSWHKHLAWARFLCENTGKPVIMFPCSFHMNRSQPEWTDRNAMVAGLETRKLLYHDIVDSSLANLALSTRLTEVPQRFFLSGYQSALDITSLLNEIKSGRHELFEAGSSIDVFAYSIGVFLAECLMIANPDHLFDNSKFVFFAGGSLFQEMNGVSRYIMDNKAFQRLYHYHLKEIDEDIEQNSSIRSVLKDTGMGKAFRSMISYDGFRNFREKGLRKYRDRILSISLAADKVIPAVPSVALLRSSGCDARNIKMLDFKFPVIHENPFPLKLKEYGNLIDEAFLKIFSLSASFLE